MNIRAGFESELPTGWTLGRPYKGNRVLFYEDIRVRRLPDDFQIENNVRTILSNPPVNVQLRMYEEGNLTLEELGEKAQKKLIASGKISATICSSLSEWASQLRPKSAQYAGKRYTINRNRWYTEEGDCIQNSVMFVSIWDARVRYSQKECSLADVARYSWSAVLECLGDDHQRFINEVIEPKLQASKRYVTRLAKEERAEKLAKNAWFTCTEFDKSSTIENEYREKVNASIWHHFHDSVENQALMFTEECNVSRFSGIRDMIQNWETAVVKQLKAIPSVLSSFRWNSSVHDFEPVFSPRVFNHQKNELLYDLLHRVMTGQISGHEAALVLTNANPKKIAQEQLRFSRSKAQFVPYYANIHKRSFTGRLSFDSMVSYVISNTRDLIKLGFRESDRIVANFNYDNCRFKVNICTGAVSYIGPCQGRYISQRWLGLKPQQRRRLLNNNVEWEYVEQAIKYYNRLFSYLTNIIFKNWDPTSAKIKANQIARNKYLKRSSMYLGTMKKKAEEYINSLSGGVVVC